MRRILSVFSLSFLALSSLSAQPTLWEKTAGPPGIRVKVIYKTNNIVYAGTETLGIYKSIDNGLSWSAANTGIERTTINDIIASGPNLLAAASAINSTCPSSVNIFKSTDNGATWTPTTGLGGLVPHNFAIKGSFVYTCTSTNLDGSGVFRSSDNGNTWQEVASPVDKVDKLFVSDNAIILAADNLILRSLNDGASWNIVEQFVLTGIQSFARAGTKLFGAAATVIWTSEDNGASWTLTPFSSGAASFAANGNTVYLGSNSKVFKSIDFGATWIDVSTGLGKGAIQALWYDGTDLFAATPNDAVGIFHSANGGTSWAPSAAGLPIASNIRDMISFGGYLFAGTDGDGIYRSPDRGDTWAKTDPGNSLLVQQLILSFCAKDNALFAGALNGIFKSIDGGATFVRTQNGFPSNTTVTSRSLTVSNGNILAAVTISVSPTETSDAIFYSSDNGDTWQQANLPVEPTSVSFLASDGSPLAYAGVFAQSSSMTGLYKSFNGGVTWVSRTSVNGSDIERLAANGNNILSSTGFTASYSRDFGELEWAPGSLPGSPAHGGVFTYTLRGSWIYAGNEGMYLSTNSGALWTPISEGFPDCPKPVVQASCADNNYLFAGTAGEGVWRKLLDAAPTPTPPPLVSISGTALYCSNPVPGPVPNVTFTLTGTMGGSTSSDGSGNYQFSSLPSGGNYTVTPTKAARPPGSANINTVDVIAVQKQFLNGTFLSGCRLTAADVNADGVVNTQDVIAIQRFFTGFTTGIANVGKYKFTPANRAYTGLVINQAGQNYDALVFGDVASPFSELPDGPPQAEANDGARASEVVPPVGMVALPEVAIDASVSDFIAQVTTTTINREDKLVGFQGDLTFDERVVTFQSEPVQNAGLTAGNWNVSGNVLPGTGPIRTLRISAYSNDFTALSGSGTLFELRMTKVRKAGQGTQLIWAAPPNQFIFIDADLKTQKPGNAAPGRVTLGRSKR